MNQKAKVAVEKLEELYEDMTTPIECSKCHEMNEPENITSTGTYQDICIFCVEEEQLDDDEDQPNKNKALRYKK